MLKIGRIILVVGFVAACVAATRPATTKSVKIAYAKGRRIATLADKSINESSGLACGKVNKNVFWTHNDSGDKPKIYAFNTAGEHLATCRIEGAKAIDWEDMCSFEIDGRAMLLIGDTGDNGKKRLHCTIYAVDEPQLNLSHRYIRRQLPIFREIRFRYQSGPRDCESIAFDPTTKTIYIITKNMDGPCEVYALPWPDKPAKKDDDPIVLRAIATLDIPATTAMDISPDGKRALVLTYWPSAYEYTRTAGKTWAQAFGSEPRILAMPWRNQGESICYGFDGKTIYLTSEKLPTPLFKVPLRSSPAPTTKPANVTSQSFKKACEVFGPEDRWSLAQGAAARQALGKDCCFTKPRMGRPCLTLPNDTAAPAGACFKTSGFPGLALRLHPGLNTNTAPRFNNNGSHNSLQTAEVLPASKIREKN